MSSAVDNIPEVRIHVSTEPQTGLLNKSRQDFTNKPNWEAVPISLLFFVIY